MVGDLFEVNPYVLIEFTCIFEKPDSYIIKSEKVLAIFLPQKGRKQVPPKRLIN
jgi:hypothetical protein